MVSDKSASLAWGIHMQAAQYHTLLRWLHSMHMIRSQMTMQNTQSMQADTALFAVILQLMSSSTKGTGKRKCTKRSSSQTRQAQHQKLRAN